MSSPQPSRHLPKGLHSGLLTTCAIPYVCELLFSCKATLLSTFPRSINLPPRNKPLVPESLLLGLCVGDLPSPEAAAAGSGDASAAEAASSAAAAAERTRREAAAEEGDEEEGRKESITAKK